MKARSIYKLDLTDVKKHIDNSVIYQRGYGYYRAGRVTHLEVRDEQIRARVTGSYGNTYKVEAWCEEGEILSTCTCPYTWSVCKHVAATLCTWLNRRADPQSYTTTTTIQLRTQLEAIPAAVLIDQILDEMRVDLLLERYVKRWLEKLSPEKLPKLIAELFRHAREGSATEPEYVLKRIARILVWSQSLPPQQAMNVVSEILKQVQARPDLANQAGCHEIVIDSLDVLRTCAPQTHPDASTKRTLLRLLVKLAESQTRLWQHSLAETLIKLSDEFGEREFLLEEVRRKAVADDPHLMRLLARLHKLEGQMEEYATIWSRCLEDENDYLELFQYYLEENRPEEAMVLAEQGMKQLESRAPQLAEKLTALYLEWDERNLAREHLLRCFEYWPTQQSLRQLETLSKGKKDWNSERARLQKKLGAKAGAPR